MSAGSVAQNPKNRSSAGSDSQPAFYGKRLCSFRMESIGCNLLDSVKGDSCCEMTTFHLIP